MKRKNELDINIVYKCHPSKKYTYINVTKYIFFTHFFFLLRLCLMDQEHISYKKKGDEFVLDTRGICQKLK